MKDNKLLRKYMLHVINEEGVSFVSNVNDAWCKVEFTEEEKKQLEEIEEEIKNSDDY